MSDWKDNWINAPMSVAVASILLTFVLSYFTKKKIEEIKKEVKIIKNNNKGKITNSPQIISGDGKITIIYNQPCIEYNKPPNKGTITSPNAVIKNEKKDQKQELGKEKNTVGQNQAEGKEKSTEKEQEMPQQEFERLLMKIKFIVFGIMGNIKWDKVKPLEFWKKENKELVKLEFEVGKKLRSIEYMISEEDKQRFLKKTSTFEIVERFITLQLLNHGKNDYFDYHCPDCKQTTLTKSLIVNSPSREEAICCNLCGWAMSMKAYLEYLNDKKYNSSLEFYEWLDEHNRKMTRIRKNSPT